MKRCFKILALLLTAVMLIQSFSFTDVSAASKKPATPKIMAKVSKKNNSVKITIDKTQNASWYVIEMKSEKDSKFTKIKKLKKDGTAKRSYTKKKLADGTYSFRVRAYAKSGSKTIKSSYSEVVTVSIGDNSSYVLPAGADSPYDLYKIMCNYKNSGKQKYLDQIYDYKLSLAIWTRWKRYDAFTKGFSVDETIVLISAMQKAMDSYIDAYKTGKIVAKGDGFDKDAFFDIFWDLYPEYKSTDLVNHTNGMFDFAVEALYKSEYKNILKTDNEDWLADSPKIEPLSKANFKTLTLSLDDYFDMTGFPEIEGCDFMEFSDTDGYLWDVNMFFIEVNGKYYFFEFDIVF